MEKICTSIEKFYLYEIWHPKKVTVSHLNIKSGNFKGDNITEEDNNSGMKIMTVKDSSNSSFGDLTWKILP